MKSVLDLIQELISVPLFFKRFTESNLLKRIQAILRIYQSEDALYAAYILLEKIVAVKEIKLRLIKYHFGIFNSLLLHLQKKGFNIKIYIAILKICDMFFEEQFLFRQIYTNAPGCVSIICFLFNLNEPEINTWASRTLRHLVGFQS